ncbi:MAG: TonB-dependent receptor [Acidobacteria bacterium]|nr:TonB-dependent receptor [Acidobacteriota bacterium]MBI3425192.1 TonB-dependent receptor [Acidobacteriota bacterium]
MPNRIFATVTWLTLLAFSAFAQTNTGRLVGTVAGPDGVIPGATVKVTDNQTGKSRTVSTSGEGSFTVPQLEIGAYTVTVSANGFKTFTANQLKIDIGQEYSLNATLEIGSTQDSVTITAGTDVLNASNAELNTTISSQQIKDLPLNGRNPLNLIAMQAGVSNNGANGFQSINGQRPSFTNITRDGLNVNDNFIRQNSGTFSPERPTVDDTGEFTLTTQNGNAAQNGGAQVQLVTPRGQQDFHGALFYFNRASVFAANDFFNNAAGLPRPFLNRNQYGGTISGPAGLPRFGQGGPAFLKDKLYFFFAFEGLRRRNFSSRSRTILTPAARTGVFTFLDSTNTRRSVNLFALAAAAGAGGAPAPTGIDPLIQSRILDKLPAAGNRTDIGDGLNTTGYGFDQANNQNRDGYATRVDFDLSQNHTFNFVYNYKKGNLLRPDADQPDGYSTTPNIIQPDRNHLFVAAYRLNLGTRFTNEVRGGYFLSRPTFGRTSAAPSFFIGGVVTPAAAANDPITPAGTSLISGPEVSFLNQGRDANVYNYQDNADYQRGNHALRFGFNSQLYRISPYNDAGIVPTVLLGTNANTPQLTAASFAAVLPAGASISATQLATANQLYALLGGVVGLAKQTFNVTGRDSGFVQGATSLQKYAWETHSFYLADQWRVRPALTLNLGLRYEYQSALRNTNSVLLEPVIKGDPVQAVLDPNGTYNFVGTNAGGNKLYHADTNNFAPVLSLAWSPNFSQKWLSRVLPGGGKTVLRGGYRISYVNDEIVTAPRNALVGNAGLGATAVNAVQTINGTATPLLNGRLGASPLGFVAPAITVPKSYAANNGPGFGNFGTVFAVDPHLGTPQTYEYNFSIQRELAGGVALEARYVGSHSNNLIRALDYNQIDIRGNGFLNDFLRARNNLLTAGNGNVNASTNFNCSPNFTGCQPLQIIGTTQVGTLGAATILNRLRSGQPADLAADYVTNGQTRGFKFLPNPNTGVADVLTNGAGYNYHALQVEARKRYAQGLYLQANYTFQKVLTNAIGTAQARFDPYLDLQQPGLEYSRADYDTTHSFNFNGIYELPFGKGRRWMSGGGVTDKVLGGWQLTSIVRLASGAPLTFIDARGTLNRTARSARQTPTSALSKSQIKDLIGVRRTKCGVFFIDPKVVDINLNDCSGTGRAARGFGTTPFDGQVFFNVPPGATGTLERAFVNGPLYANVDASILKNFAITEKIKFQLRAEAFNLFNRANFGVDGVNTLQTGAGALFNINSPTFGRLAQTVAPNDTFRVLQFGARLQF